MRNSQNPFALFASVLMLLTPIQVGFVRMANATAEDHRLPPPCAKEIEWFNGYVEELFGLPEGSYDVLTVDVVAHDVLVVNAMTVTDGQIEEVPVTEMLLVYSEDVATFEEDGFRVTMTEVYGIVPEVEGYLMAAYASIEAMSNGEATPIGSLFIPGPPVNGEDIPDGSEQSGDTANDNATLNNCVHMANGNGLPQDTIDECCRCIDIRHSQRLECDAKHRARIVRCIIAAGSTIVACLAGCVKWGGAFNPTACIVLCGGGIVITIALCLTAAFYDKQACYQKAQTDYLRCLNDSNCPAMFDDM